MEFDPTTRKLDDGAPMPGSRYIRTADAAFLDETTEGNPMHTDDHVEEAVAERVERNTRWGRDAGRDTALAELVNEGTIPMWEERPPVRPRERQGSAVEVRDDF